MQTGFDSTSLALFTGLAPCGTVAFMVLALYLLLCADPADSRARRVTHWLACPLAVVWIGFIASATHLGTPANALYALSNLGSSPLSNEVAATVSFLFSAGVLWLYSFAERPSRFLVRCGLVMGIATGAALLAFTSLAYDVPTVPTWHTRLVPMNLLAGAACGGCALASFVLSATEAPRPKWPVALLVVSVVVLVAGTALLLAYVEFLTKVGNNVVALGGAVGDYPRMIVVHDVLAAVGVLAMWAALSIRLDHRRRTALSAAGCLIVLAGMVVIRFPFYEAYLSVGF